MITPSAMNVANSVKQMTPTAATFRKEATVP